MKILGLCLDILMVRLRGDRVQNKASSLKLAGGFGLEGDTTFQLTLGGDGPREDSEGIEDEVKIWATVTRKS